MPEDWFVIGVDPLKSHLLVKCRLTQRTGVVPDASLQELSLASAQNFESYPWVEPHRVQPQPIKQATMNMSRQSQKLSGILRNPANGAHPGRVIDDRSGHRKAGARSLRSESPAGFVCVR